MRLVIATVMQLVASAVPTGFAEPVYPIGPEAAINTTEKIFHLKITEKNINDKGFVDAMKVDIYLIQLRELKKITDEVWKWQCDFYIP